MIGIGILLYIIIYTIIIPEKSFAGIIRGITWVIVKICEVIINRVSGIQVHL